MQNISKLFPLYSRVTEIMNRIWEIKYTDEMDYIVEGLDNDEIDESLMMMVGLMDDERFKTYMKESRHLEEMIQVVSKKKISKSASSMLIEALSQVFNPYSFTDLGGLFKTLLMIFDDLLLDRTSLDSFSCIESKTKAIVEILRKIPIKWYSRLSKCVELRKIVLGLQVFMSEGIIKWNKFLLSLLAECPEFDLSEGFIEILLKKGKNYEVIANYTKLEENVGRLSLSPNFKTCLRKAVLKEFIENKSCRSLEDVPKENFSDTIPSVLKRREESPRVLNRRKYLMIILVNLVSKNFHLGIPLDIIARVYYTVDKVTRCYVALLLLISIQGSEKDAIQSAYAEDLKENVRCLAFDPCRYLCKEVLDRLVEISS
ncbi:hypothetical protein KMI_06g11230 [Encephalitozoon hellem]|nr:hypothetical protein KMI_06g11230 [Encephalitozoon hellem]